MLTSILLILDQSAAAQPRLDLAVSLARRHGAAITGLLLTPGLHGDGGQSRGDLAELFRIRTSAAGITADWFELAGPTDRYWRELLHLAHCSSLVVVGQTAGESEAVLPADLPERLVAASGRPVLTVPVAGRFDSCGERVLVAWSDGRESTRALHDAMPLLERAQRVHLVKLITDAARINGSGERMAMVIDYLKRSGVKAKGDILLSIDFPPGDMLLNRACEEHCDLLVMGALNEAGERIALGRVAHHVLQYLTLPVLMSH